MTADVLLHPRKIRPIGTDHERSIDLLPAVLLLLAPSAAHEKEDPVSVTIPERVIDEKRRLFDIRDILGERISKLLERNQESFLARLDVDSKNAVVLGMGDALGPVEGPGIAGDRTQPRHPTVVDRQEAAALLRDA